MARDTHVTINTTKRPEATMTTHKDLARTECFSAIHTKFEPSEKALKLFDQAYEYGRKEGQREVNQEAVQQAFVDGKRAVEELHNLYEGCVVLTPERGYEKLVEVLGAAHHQAAMGKGKERHANEKPFEQQRMLSIARTMKDPAASLAYQVSKKVTEGLQFDDPARTVVELLGAINYLAGMVILIQERPVPAATESVSRGKTLTEMLEDPALKSRLRGQHVDHADIVATGAVDIIREIRELSPESAELVRDFLDAQVKRHKVAQFR